MPPDHAVPLDWKPFLEIAQFGALGIFCLALMAAVVVLWKDRKQLITAIDELKDSQDRANLAILTLVLTLPHVVDSVRAEAEAQKEAIQKAQARRGK